VFNYLVRSWCRLQGKADGSLLCRALRDRFERLQGIGLPSARSKPEELKMGNRSQLYP
jgi:hypothetical protein